MSFRLSYPHEFNMIFVHDLMFDLQPWCGDFRRDAEQYITSLIKLHDGAGTWNYTVYCIHD